MDVIHTIAEVRERLSEAKGIAFVPTMGNLHEGHMSLIRKAVELKVAGKVDCIVASVFVNRLQFAPDEDFDTYPRTLNADAEKLKTNGCDVVFAPSEKELYPEEQLFHVLPPKQLDDILEGHFRPGFFQGVCTVVHKLFNIVQPQHAIFGKKDYQQLAIIKQMVAHMALPIQIHGAEIVRDAFGLALSSRNGYFDAAQLVKARELNACLRALKEKVVQQAKEHLIDDYNRLEKSAEQTLHNQGWKVDYVCIRAARDLQEPNPNNLQTDGNNVVILAAATINGVRLIDNLECPLS